MPVLREILTNPTDVLLQAESFRSEVFGASVGSATLAPIVGGDQSALAVGVVPLIGALQSYDPMQPDWAASVGSTLGPNSLGAAVPRKHGCIATPCGALVQVDSSPAACMHQCFTQATSRWVINATTQDSGGTPIAGVRVMAFTVGRLYEGGQPLQVEGITDGSGLVTLDVPTNVDYLLVAYKSGSPDVAGVSVQTVGPTQV